MAKMTRREMLKVYLGESYEAKEIPSKNKYEMMEGIDRKGKVIYFFLGSNGALRAGSTKAAAKSVSFTNTLDMERIKNFLDERGLFN